MGAMNGNFICSIEDARRYYDRVRNVLKSSLAPVQKTLCQGIPAQGLPSSGLLISTEGPGPLEEDACIPISLCYTHCIHILYSISTGNRNVLHSPAKAAKLEFYV